MNTRATFLMLSGLFFLRSHAQEQVKIDTTKAVSLQEVQITSVRGSEKLTHIPTSVTLVNAKQLQILSRTTSNISQLLEATVAGLGPSTGTYSNFGQYLRGRGMLIMLDGIPQSTPIRDGGVDMKTVNANDLRAVEVIKGATSLYGVGGSGGFVNYITKEAVVDRKFAGNTQIWGTANLAETDAAFGGGVYQSLSGTAGRWEYYLSGSYEKTGNMYDAKGTPLLPTYSLANTDTYSALAKIGYQIADKQKLKLRYNYYRSAQKSNFAAADRVLTVFNGDGDYELIPGFGVAGEIPGVPPGAVVHNAQFTYALDSIFRRSTTFQTDAFYQNVDNIFFYAKNFQGGGQSRVKSEKYGVRPNFNSRLALHDRNHFSLPYGLDVLRDNTSQPLVDGRLWMPEITLMNWAPYAQAKWVYDENWIVKIGGRYDAMQLQLHDYQTLPYSAQANDVFSESIAVQGGRLSFSNAALNLGIRYNKHAEFTPYASYAQGFALPDVGVVFRNAQVKDIQEINVKPVATDNFEFGFVSTFPHVRFEAVGYYSKSKYGTSVSFNEQSNRFELVQSPQSIFGADVTLDVDFYDGKLQAGATYSFLEGLTHTATNPYVWKYIGGQMINPPKTTAYVHVAATRALDLDVQAVFIGDRQRFAPIQHAETNMWSYRHTEVPVKGYTLVNLQASYQLNSRAGISLAINNLFNAYYMPAKSQWMAFVSNQSPAGEGVNARITLNYQF